MAVTVMADPEMRSDPYYSSTKPTLLCRIDKTLHTIVVEFKLITRITAKHGRELISQHEDSNLMKSILFHFSSKRANSI